MATAVPVSTNAGTASPLTAATSRLHAEFANLCGELNDRAASVPLLMAANSSLSPSKPTTMILPGATPALSAAWIAPKAGAPQAE